MTVIDKRKSKAHDSCIANDFCHYGLRCAIGMASHDEVEDELFSFFFHPRPKAFHRL